MAAPAREDDPAQVFEGRQVIARQGHQVLTQDATCPQITTMAERRREQPRDPPATQRRGELQIEVGEAGVRTVAERAP